MHFDQGVQMYNLWRKPRPFLAATAIAGLTLALAGTASAQAAATVTVCPSGCAFSQIAPALAAAKNGDTISIGAGTYDGGLTVDKSVKLVGAGSGRTTISGGGPVLTIGTFGAANEPTVTIDGVTITGGVTRSSPMSIPFTRHEGVFAAGGGVEIPPGADFAVGATVTMTNTVVTGNRVAPTDTVGPRPEQLPFWPICPTGPCPFAGAIGGGVDNWGTLTLTNSTVSNNRVGTAAGLSDVASDAEGAGIHSDIGTLTISNSAISGNRASASAPNGRFTDSGALFLAGGTLTMNNSSVTNNSATLAAAFPSSVDMGVHAGAIHFSQNAQAATVTNTTISGNAATMTNSVGDSFADSAGLHTDIDVSVNDHLVTLSNDVIANNHVTSTTVGGSSGNADGSSGAGELSGTFSNIRLTGNTVDVRSATGSASGEGGASVFDGGSFTNSLIADNRVHVSAPGGSATVQGGGIFVAVSLTLRNSTVNGNTGDASGASGSAKGGGIFDVAFPFGPDGPPGGPLVLQNSSLTGNALTGSVSLILQGGGLYLENEPLTFANSVIANNSPDQCFGC
jgi:hypothetical protein